MNANRRADLQRKLAVAPVPKPPANLAARIKSDIPKELRFSAERERARLAQSVRLSMAVAASVIVVIFTAYLALQVTSTKSVEPAAKPAASVPLPVVPPQPSTQPAPPPAIVAPQTIEVRQAPRRLKKENAPAVADSLNVVSADQSGRVQAQAAQDAREEKAAPSPAATGAVAESITISAAAPAAKMSRNETAPEKQMTISPVSGKTLVRDGERVYDATDKTTLTLTSWKDASNETKIQILKAELARGADPEEVARVAREAGLDEFAASIEKKH